MNKLIKTTVSLISLVILLINPLKTNADPPDWTPAPNMLFNMNITSKLQLEDGAFSLNPNDMVAGFVGEECRGVMSPNSLHSGLIFLTVGSNSAFGETITFKAYIADEDLVVELNETLIFENLAMIGSVADPFHFTYDVEPPGFTVNFIVTNQQNDLLPDAEIIFNGTHYPAGHYQIENVEHGVYDYHISRDGYHDASGIVAVTDNDVTIDITLYSVVTEPPNWIAETNLLFNMNITSRLLLSNGHFSLNSNDLIAGFVNDECRGVVSPSSSFNGLIFLTIGSNISQGETIHFKAYISEQQKIVDLEQILVFENLSMIGNPSEPFIFSYLSVPDILYLADIFIYSGETVCFNATEQIIASHQDTEFIIYDGAEARIISGISIKLLPGTHVKQGAAMHAIIDNVFCNNLPEVLPKVNEREMLTSIKKTDSSQISGVFNIYPNPTDGLFTLELHLVQKKKDITVEIVNTFGNQVLFVSLPSSTQKHFLNMAGQKPGMYFIRLNYGDGIEIQRLIVK